MTLDTGEKNSDIARTNPALRGAALVVDDDVTNRVILRALLRKLGYEVFEACDGLEAVERFVLVKPNIVLMDIMMPRMDGYEATQRIKTLCGDRFIPVIFLTARTDEESLARCIDAGGDDVLTKPFRYAILNSKILAMGRIRGLYRDLSTLYDRFQRDHEIAEQVFHSAVLDGNVATEYIRSLLRPAEIFSGDVLLTAYSPSGDLHVLLGDFTGHGLAASLGALPTAEVFRAMTAKGFSVNEILRAINLKLHKLLPTAMFLALQLLRVSSDMDHITLCNCGMPDVLVLDGRTGDIRDRIQSSGLPLGIDPEISFRELVKRVNIGLGDRVLLASDGLIEAQNSRGDFFGKHRYEQAVAAAKSCGTVFDRISMELEDFCGKTPQSDDISLAEIPCEREMFLLPNPAARLKDDPVPAAQSRQEPTRDRLEFSLTLQGSRLQKADPVPLIINQLMELHEGQGNQQALFTILTELYTNAVDHGVLGLDSAMKHSPDGFFLYFKERELRLTRLRQEWVRIGVCVLTGEQHSRIAIRIADSGPGFDYQTVMATPHATTVPSGRGIHLVMRLCESLEYEGVGNKLEAIFLWGDADT